MSVCTLVTNSRAPLLEIQKPCKSDEFIGRFKRRFDQFTCNSTPLTNSGVQRAANSDTRHRENAMLVGPNQRYLVEMQTGLFYSIF